MAEGVVEETPQNLEADMKAEEEGADAECLQEEMDLEAPNPPSDTRNAVDMSIHTLKRTREETEEEANALKEDDAVSKKLKSERSVEEKRLESVEGKDDDGEGEKEDQRPEEAEGKEDNGEEGEKETSDAEQVVAEQEKESSEPVNLGPKTFSSSLSMFNYFFKLLHYWQPNIDVNEYEYMVLLDLIKKGHTEPDKKIGEGVNAFQVRFHPTWKSRCFFLVRGDGSVDDFSFRKCVDKLIPLPDNMKAQSMKDDGKKSQGRNRGGHGFRGRHRKGAFKP